MGRPRNADGQRTRQAILDAALALFADKGYFGTTLRDVAAAVGVRESALYNYFPSKDALFEALIAADQDSRVERIAGLVDEAGDDGRALLERLALVSLEDFQAPRQQQLFRILMSDGIRLARQGRLNLAERMGAGRARLGAIMRHLMASGLLRDANPDTLAVSFQAPLVFWRHMHAVDPNHPLVRNARAFAAEHVDQFLRGAAATAARPKAAATPAARRRPRATRQRRRGLPASA